ncbi:p-loop containing nucleoside triphosphate hydrolase protein [Phaffia rhodozyma]|uniref:p-loop containing nucleoside triphosphate hydrolase protein n=1 Tax=Phaffia rhodozyma TaxID=264483 RepID=A0A0F7SNF7_PHARH|nr:p-loop containing nucleoside triphosphate hydrolase protein [Phaffia rhodozyma]
MIRSKIPSRLLPLRPSVRSSPLPLVIQQRATLHLLAPSVAAGRVVPLGRQSVVSSISIRRSYADKPGSGGGGFKGFKMNPMGGGMEEGEALKQFSIDLTEMAREGKMDPVIGRDDEIKRTIQILSRRTKSNPVLLGPAGVGKTAILEGLAQRVVNGEVPESLLNKRVLALDLSALLAGAGVRGVFEERFKALLKDIDREAGQVICFIDEIHGLLNLGKSEGSIDAGNMIKPALARGLQLVGATTPDEYRKTIEKDPALSRRFQPVKVEEPTVASTISILRGLKGRYEVHHGVGISDSALVTAAVYSQRYIPDRFLPDKAIDLVDEAASSLRIAQESKPPELEALEREIMTLEIERESLKNETDTFSIDRNEIVLQELEEKKQKGKDLEGIWAKEKNWLKDLKQMKFDLEKAKIDLEIAQRNGSYEDASRLRYDVIPNLQGKIPRDDEAGSSPAGEGGMMRLRDRVTSEDVAKVVARSTGIPVNSLLKGEKERLIHMEDALTERVVGQEHVVTAVSDAVRLSRAGLQNPQRPLASFLFLGPTGVGKTELAKALAGFLFDDEKHALVTINMSEYHDRHTVSRLIGAAPGYVGFEEGGQLTEAVRRRPYAVINLDEVEKAHRDVSNILLQVLDEGRLTDSSGREIDFKNTILCLTSNLGSEAMAIPGSTDSLGRPTAETQQHILEAVSRHFPPELVNRLDNLLIFNKLSRKAILSIVDLRLGEISRRLADRRIVLSAGEEAKEWIAKEGWSETYGARSIARLISKELLAKLARKLVEGRIRNGDTVTITVSSDGKALDLSDNHEPDNGLSVHDAMPLQVYDEHAHDEVFDDGYEDSDGTEYGSGNRIGNGNENTRN